MNGVEWIVEAHGCPQAVLCDLPLLKNLFDRIVADLELRPVRKTLWHQFPVTGGFTGLCLLSESHLTCHTFPEYGSLCLNLFCCRERAEWGFDRQLKVALSATSVSVRRLERPYTSPEYRVASSKHSRVAAAGGK